MEDKYWKFYKIEHLFDFIKQNQDYINNSPTILRGYSNPSSFPKIKLQNEGFVVIRLSELENSAKVDLYFSLDNFKDVTNVITYFHSSSVTDKLFELIEKIENNEK
jgi:hypothetical protein